MGTLIGFGSILVGVGLYFYPPLLAGFPVNDGGLFYNMIRAVQENGFRLPDFVQYNGLTIPFVYPPFGFYVGALVSVLLRAEPLLIIQWLPSFTLVGISIAFYFLAARVLTSRLEAGIATFLYVCTPRSMTWLVMGGGLTRGLGQLFLILTVTNAYALLTDGRRKLLISGIVFGALVIVTHPEASLHTAAICALLWLVRGRNRQAIGQGAIMAGGVAALSAVWWLPRLLRFGIEPFISAAKTGLHTSILFVYPFLLTFTEEPAVTLIAALGLIGIAACVAKREYLLPVWMLLPYAIEPRGAGTVAIIPLALMGGIGVIQVILPRLRSTGQSPAAGEVDPGRNRWTIPVLGSYVALFLLLMGTYAAMQLSQVSLTPGNRAALAWVAANTPTNSQFLILTGGTDLFCDPVQEWFPVLTPALSVTTIQGYEWQSNGAFFLRTAELQDMQRCVSGNSPLDCIESQADKMGAQFDYLYLSKQTTTRQFCRATGESTSGAALSAQIMRDPGYREVYKSDAVEIYSVVR